MQSVELGSIRLFPGHLRIFSGRVCVGFLEETPGGIRDLIAPPFVAAPMTVRFHVRDDASGELAHDCEPATPGYRQAMLLQRGSWRLDRLERTSVYHQRLGGRKLVFQWRQRVIALADRPGVLVEFERLDLDGPLAGTSLVPEIDLAALGRVEPGGWTWSRPRTEGVPRRRGEFLWEGEGVSLRLRANAPIRGAGFAMDRPTLHVLLEFVEGSSVDAETFVSDEEVAEARAAADRAFEERLTWLETTFPTFTSDNTDLDRWYERSRLGALCCRWDHPDFVVRPFFASEGMDGGGTCSYLWDLSYLSRMAPWMFGRDLSRAMLEAFRRMDPSRHFAFDPFDGRGFGPPYALNAYSLTTLVREHVAWHQDFEFLRTEDEHEGWLAALERASEAGAPSAFPPLLDYGNTKNLLELRTAGYEHVVPSPNAERAWILRFLADVREERSLGRSDELRQRAAAIEQALERHLWNARTGWFECTSADGRERESVSSVQILTLLGLDGLPTHFREGLLAKIRDGVFLGTHGLHGIALDDLRHWESGDVDWGGSGSYVGQAPRLVLDLYRLGRSDLAETLLERLLWWARAYPYFPQSIRADREAYCDFDRPNCIAGLAGVQAIVHGLCGVEALWNGALKVQPHALRRGGFELRGLPWRTGRLDVTCDGRLYRATLDGRECDAGEVVPAAS